MQRRSSKSNRHGLSIRDMFSKQSIKRKHDNIETNEQKIQLSEDDETKDNTLITNEYNKENHNSQLKEEHLNEHSQKKTRTENNMVAPKSQIKQENVLYEKCEYCHQKLNGDIKFYPGHPNGAVDEEIALIDPKLCLFSGDEMFIHENDQLPQNKLTYFR